MAANPVEMTEMPKAREHSQNVSGLTQPKPNDTALIVSDLTQNHGEIKPRNKPPKTRGGRRKGAGRKPKWEKALQKHVAKPITAAIVLAEHDELRLWGRFLSSPDARIALDAAKYLTDRRDGKAKQAIEHLGPDGGPLQAAVLVKFVESDK